MADVPACSDVGVRLERLPGNALIWLCRETIANATEREKTARFILLSSTHALLMGKSA